VAEPVIFISTDIDALSRQATDLFVEAAEKAIASHGRFSVALSGGSTPKILYTLLGSPSHIQKVDWEKTDIFWGDERCVPPTDEQSNYHIARQAILHKVPASLHRIRGEDAPEEAAHAYEDELRRAFGLKMKGESPRFDLILLGMGEDGHTASLFHGDMALNERERFAVPVTDMAVPRVTLTLPVLNHASAVMFLVAGEGKAGPLRHILEEGNSRGYPAGLVRPVGGGTVTWLVDRAAASGLRHTGVEVD
jgi:6-phosphogluconolactonase